jgi:hypothetical protein
MLIIYPYLLPTLRMVGDIPPLHRMQFREKSDINKKNWHFTGTTEEYWQEIIFTNIT